MVGEAMTAISALKLLWPYLQNAGEWATKHPKTVVGAAGLGSLAYGGYKTSQQQAADRLNPPVDNVNVMDPQQRALIDALTKLSGQHAQSTYPYQMEDASEGFAPMEQQARTGFNQQMVPGLAEAFTKMGLGAQRSSAFPLAMGQIYGDFESDLAAQQGKYQQQRQGQQQGFMNLLQGGAMQKPYEPVYNQQKPFPWGRLAGIGASTYFMKGK
jgi:hypothetical protein